VSQGDVDLRALAAEIQTIEQIDGLLDQMLEVAAILEEALAPLGVHPVVVGGLALAYWTPPGLYLTEDIDVVMPAIPAAEERLAKLGFVRDGRYWTLPGHDLFLEAPGSLLEPNPEGFDIVETQSGRQVRVQAPEDLFGLRFGEFVALGTPDVFQQLLWLLGSTELVPSELESRADDSSYLRQIGVSRRAYLEGLETLRTYAEKIQRGDKAPEMWEIHEMAARLQVSK